MPPAILIYSKIWQNLLDKFCLTNSITILLLKIYFSIQHLLFNLMTYINSTAIKRNFIAERIHKVKPSGIRRFFGIAASMPDVISLGIGEPDFSTPAPIAKA